MRLPFFAVAAVLLGAPIAAQQQDAGFGFEVRLARATIEARLMSTQTDFFGGVLVSADPYLAHYYVGLPPLLANGSLLGFGFASGEALSLSLPLKPPPPIGLVFYAQGVIVGAGGIESSQVEKLTVTDGALNEPPK